MYKLGIIGYPLGHSISAAIQKAGFESLGLEGSYDVLETPPEDLIQRIKYLKNPHPLPTEYSVVRGAPFLLTPLKTGLASLEPDTVKRGTAFVSKKPWTFRLTIFLYFILLPTIF